MAKSYNVSHFVAYLLILCGLASCSKIFESREHCPAVVFTDFSEIGPEIENLMMWLEDSEGNSYSAAVPKSEFGQLRDFYVAKGDIRCFVWGNVKSATICSIESKMTPKATLFKRDEVLCDSLYFFTKKRYVTTDTVVIKVHPNKQFANIFLTVLEAGLYEEIKVTLNTPSRGFYYDGNIASGSSQTIAAVQGDRSRLRLLRQQDLQGISLDFLYQYRGEKSSLNFDLSKYLIESKYDMNAIDMKDIYLTIDLVNMRVSLSIDGWNVVIDIGIEI